MENLRLKIVFSQTQLFVKPFILTCFVPFIQSNLSNPKACQYVPLSIVKHTSVGTLVEKIKSGRTLWCCGTLRRFVPLLQIL